MSNVTLNVSLDDEPVKLLEVVFDKLDTAFVPVFPPNAIVPYCPLSIIICELFLGNVA